MRGPVGGWGEGAREGGHGEAFSFPTVRLLEDFQVEVSSTPMALGVECSGEAWLGLKESLSRDWTMSQIPSKLIFMPLRKHWCLPCLKLT